MELYKIAALHYLQIRKRNAKEDLNKYLSEYKKIKESPCDVTADKYMTNVLIHKIKIKEIEKKIFDLDLEIGKYK